MCIQCMKRLPDEEWQRRYKANAARQNKRTWEAKIYLKNNHLKEIMCDTCNAFGYIRVGRITTNTVRISCAKCKNSRIIKVVLPKRFVPTK